ncbi:hypothetical protein IP88_16360 [alpha proteobacterium AAP81b]|nr:hypothetical protein IP88_16360 [alpha proteobacterium AAP81b]
MARNLSLWLALLLGAAPVPALAAATAALPAPAPPPPLVLPQSVDVANQTALLVFQSSARLAALARQASSALRDRDQAIAAKDGEIAALTAQFARTVASATRDRQTLTARIAALVAANADAKLGFAAELAAHDEAFSREREALLTAATNLLQTPDGARALRLFNAGGKANWQEAKLVLARLEKVRAAADKRASAYLYLDAYNRGYETAEACIAQFEAVVANDPSEFVDWTALSRLQREAGQSEAALRSLDSLVAWSSLNSPKAIAANYPLSRMVAFMELGAWLKHTGDLPGALYALQEGLKLQRELAARDPDAAAAVARGGTWSVFCDLGDLLTQRGDRLAALAAYQDGLKMARALAARDPGSWVAQRGVSQSLWKLAEAGAPGATWQAVVDQLTLMQQQQGALEPWDEDALTAAKAKAGYAR